MRSSILYYLTFPFMIIASVILLIGVAVALLFTEVKV